MVSSVSNISQSNFQTQTYQRKASTTDSFEPLNSFAEEDEAIISSQAKLLNELEKFNAGEGDAIDLALASVMSKFTVSAEVNVINTKKEMMDCILEIGN